MSADFPTAPLAPGHKGAGGGTVEKSHHRLTHKKPDTPAQPPQGDATNESYRFRHSSATAKSRIKAREQSKRGKSAGKDAPF